MLAEAPGNTGLMNNFGYALIDDHASDAETGRGFQAPQGGRPTDAE